MANEPIEFGRKELDPEEEKKYREAIERARNNGVNSLKGSEPVGRAPKPQIPNLTSGIRQPGQVLSPETLQQLKDLESVQQKEETVAKQEQAKEEVERNKEDLLALLDLDGRSEAERILKNRKRREAIEARCEPMDFEDLLYKDEVQQVVTIIPGKFTATYRSLTPEESLFIKRYLAKYPSPSDQHALERYGLCLLTCSLVAINGKDLPDHRDESGSPIENLFETKLKVIQKKSGYIIADLGVNYEWFDLRVRKLINPDDLKNG